MANQSQSRSTEHSRLLEPERDTSASPGSKTLNDEQITEDSSTAFRKADKQFIVFLAAIAGFFPPFRASIYFPALKSIATSLGVKIELMNLTVTMYLIVQGIVPSVFAEMS